MPLRCRSQHFVWRCGDSQSNQQQQLNASKWMNDSAVIRQRHHKRLGYLLIALSCRIHMNPARDLFRFSHSRWWINVRCFRFVLFCFVSFVFGMLVSYWDLFLEISIHFFGHGDYFFRLEFVSFLLLFFFWSHPIQFLINFVFVSIRFYSSWNVVFRGGSENSNRNMSKCGRSKRFLVGNSLKIGANVKLQGL